MRIKPFLVSTCLFASVSVFLSEVISSEESADKRRLKVEMPGGMPSIVVMNDVPYEASEIGDELELPFEHVKQSEDAKGYTGSTLDGSNGQIPMLTSDTHDDIVKKSTGIVVLYYASWCGFSQQFLPLFKSTALAMSGQVSFAAVHGPENMSVLTSHKVTHYPYLIYYSHGHEVRFDLPNKSEFPKWVETHHFPVVELDKTKSATESITNFLKNAASSSSRVIGYFIPNSAKTKIYQNTFEMVARAGRTSRFAETGRSRVISRLIDKHPDLKSLLGSDWSKKNFILILTDHTLLADRVKVIFDDLDNEESLIMKVNASNLASVTPFSMQHHMSILKDARPLIVLFTGGQVNVKSSLKFAEAAHENPEFAFVTSGVSEQPELGLARKVGVSLNAAEGGGITAPAILLISREFDGNIYDLTDRYVLANNGKFDAENIPDLIEKSVKQYKENTLPMFVKSEDIPSFNEDYVGLVLDIVGSTYKEFTQSDKDTAVLVYAPWCGHCTAMKPEWDQLATVMERIKTVRIARINGDRNDTPGYKVDGFPTILFYRARKPGVNEIVEPVQLITQSRNKVEFAKAIQAHATHKFELTDDDLYPKRHAEAKGLLMDEL